MEGVKTKIGGVTSRPSMSGQANRSIFLISGNGIFDGSCMMHCDRYLRRLPASTRSVLMLHRGADIERLAPWYGTDAGTTSRGYWVILLDGRTKVRLL